MILTALSFAVTLVDCPILINLALGLNINTQQPSIMSQLYSNCCSASGVTCDSNSRVTQIAWAFMNLDGWINGSSLPPLLTQLDVSVNSLTGNIPLSWPNTMTSIIVGDNYLSGTFVPPTTWPPNLATFIFGFNFISGTVPSVWPAGLTYMDINQNPMYCNSPTWPPAIVELHINGLGCTGDSPVFPSTLKILFLGWGPERTSHNKFSGTLVLNQPTFLDISYNLITNLIIADTSVLTSGNCDLSYNPLLNSPSIVNLTMCTENGLYSPYSLPYTISSKIHATHTFSSKIHSTPTNISSKLASTQRQVAEIKRTRDIGLHSSKRIAMNASSLQSHRSDTFSTCK